MPVHRIDPVAPLLRSPPFPAADAAVSRIGFGEPATVINTDRIFAAIRDARIGGDFWLPPAPEHEADIVIRARTWTEWEAIRAGHSGVAVRAGAVDPWSLLNGTISLLAHGDDEWVALAHIAGCPVRILSDGRFGAREASRDEIARRVGQALVSACYRDPFTGDNSTIENAVEQLADWRRVLEANAPIVAACGMAWWKRREIARFLWSSRHKLCFFSSEKRAIADAERKQGALAIWPSRTTPGLVEAARERKVPLVRVEDGFVRSIGLGSNLVPPSSIAVDHLGIHYDPSRPSDLEEILAQRDFPPALIDRATRLRSMILTAGISKYGREGQHPFPPRLPGRRLVLVPGQVEDDMSVRLGGGGLTSNLDLLRHARALEPEAEIWFRPHPDVDAGHRRGKVDDVDALTFADRIVRGGGMAPLLDLVDAVHVLTSLTGFEALLRRCEVVCHGMPFYAGWGLTQDLAVVPERRRRVLTLDQLVAAVLIIYPRYLDPVTGLPCSAEVLIRRMTDGRNHNRLGWISLVRQWQGRLMRRLA